MVELLVCLGIFTILLALLLGGVQAAREAGRRASCQNNLRQLVVATTLYHDNEGCFPMSVSPFWEGQRPAQKRDGTGWIVRTLPYLEQGALFEQFSPIIGTDFLSGEGLRSPLCRQAIQEQVRVLHCPSDSSADYPSDKQFQLWDIEVALTNYKGCMGDNRMGGSASMFPGFEPDCKGSGNCPGIFYRVTYQDRVKMSQILDGTSQTFAVGEDVPRENNHSAAFYANGDYASCHAPLNYFPQTPTPDDWWNVMSFRSRHPRGASFAYADQSVKFVSDSTNYNLYRALSTKAQGEFVGE